MFFSLSDMYLVTTVLGIYKYISFVLWRLSHDCSRYSRSRSGSSCNNNDYKQHNEYATALLHTIPLFHNQPTIITGNWNMHHHLWSFSPNVNSSMETDCMVDWLMIHGYLLSNISGQHTYISHTSQKTPSVLDLTFPSYSNTQSYPIGQSNQSLPLTLTI